MYDSKGEPIPAVKRLLNAGIRVASADVFLTGEFVEPGKLPRYPAVNETYHGYTFGYNRPVLSNRVRDILTFLRYLQKQDPKTIHLVGTGKAGLWVLMARAVAAGKLGRTIVDLRGVGFENVHSAADPMFLPGALKYGGIGGLAALAAPGELTVAGIRGVSPRELKPLKRVYRAAGGRLVLEDEGLTADMATEKLLR